MRNLHRVDGSFAGRWHPRNFLHQFDSRIIALAKDRIAAIQARIRYFSDKELGAVGVRSGIGISETPRPIKGHRGGSLILEFVARITAAIARRISALNHELRN